MLFAAMHESAFDVIIVKQHGGSIEVDTQPDEFTEFRIVLPRRAATIAKSGGGP
jgi:nitrogen-specific signal transduction histidine kinase